MNNVLVTGGCGYIGSHVCVELLNNGYDVVIVDNFCNSDRSIVEKIERIVNKKVTFREGDVRDEDFLQKVFGEFKISSVLHFAGLKSVSESVNKPIEYYENNFFSTLALCNVMKKSGVYTLIFSSSATVYGLSSSSPISEDGKVGELTNPYGRTKYFSELLLKDLVESDARWSISSLRYFNPIGAHKSALIGEKPSGVPNNLLPYITQVAIGKMECLKVYGNDYLTRDGTGVRDYIHVVDLAQGHVAALKGMGHRKGLHTYNLGTGVGYSVLEVIKKFQEVNGIKIPYTIEPRRPGDIGECWSDPSKAQQELGWSTVLDISDMLRDAWAWEINKNS